MHAFMAYRCAERRSGLALQRACSLAEAVERASNLVAVLAARAPATEALRSIPKETLDDLHEAGLFRILQPRRVGGAELPYGAIVCVTAMLARGCASTAWVLANLANHHFMLALWPRKAQDEIWGEDPASLVGSALMFPPGKATKAGGGYRLSGRWKFSSGIDACRWTMLGGIASADGELPDYRVFLLPASDYQMSRWKMSSCPSIGRSESTR
jgi:3-hydroxy-9,10-secoandrosta-1,3,5(10)-triene-9,17-dione monooxygenase